MKKYPKDFRLRRIQYRRRNKLEIRKKRRADARPRTRTRQAHNAPPQKYTITAPMKFSLTEDPEETLEFFETFREKLPSEKLRIEIDLRAVAKIDPDAVAVFVAIMKSVPHDHPVSGPVPQEQACTQRLYDFGFFDHVRSRVRLGEPSGKIQRQHTGKQVSGQAARDIIHFGLSKLRREGAKHGPTYNVFTEVMSNTFQHADKDGKKGNQSWLAAVYYDDEKRAACFTAVDLGVGIIGNFNLRQRMQATQFRLTGVDQGEKLRRLLCGEIRSRTGDPHRGRGLPYIKQSCDSGRITNLSILSNKALARTAHAEYRELKTGFRGTIIYWELGEDDA